MTALSDVENLRLRDIEDGDVRDDPQWRALLGQGRKRRRTKHTPGGHQHNQQDHAGDGVPDVPNPLDKLGLAKRIQLGPGEKLLSSRKIRTDDDSFDFLAAEVDTPGARQVRLGIIGPDTSKLWAAGPDPKRKQRAEELDAQIARIENDEVQVDGDTYDQLVAERQELDEADEDYNRTAILTAAAVAELRGQLQSGAERGRAHQKAYVDFRNSSEGQRLDDLYEEHGRRVAEFRRISSAFLTDDQRRRQAEVEAAFDAEHGAEVRRLEALDPIPDTEAVFAEGHVPGGPDGDLHYRVAGYDNSKGGWDIELGIKPPDAGETWGIGSIADDKAVFEGSRITGLLKALQELESGDQPKSSRRNTQAKHGSHNQQDHGNRGVDLSDFALDGIDITDPGRYEDTYGDVFDEESADLGDDIALSVRYFENGDMHAVWDLPGRQGFQVLEEMDPQVMRSLAADITEVLNDYDSRDPDNDGDDAYEVMFDADSDTHDFYVGVYGTGDVRLQPNRSTADEQAYFEISAEQARSFVEALENMADSYEEQFYEAVDEKSARRKHQAGRHNQQSHAGDVDAPDFPLNQLDKRTVADIRKWYGGLNGAGWSRLSSGAQKAAVELADSESIDNGNHHPAEVLNALKLGIPHVGLRSAKHMPPEVMLETSTKDVNDWYGQLSERDYRGLGDRQATVFAVAKRQAAKGNPLPQQKLDALRAQVKADPGKGLVGRTPAVDDALAKVPPAAQIGTPATDVNPRDFNWIEPKRAEQIQDRLNQDDPWTRAQRTALSSYTDKTYLPINGGLRNPEKPGDEHDKVRYLQRAADIQSAMRPWPENTRVYRGTSTDQFGLDLDPDDYEQLEQLVGREFVDEGFTSTSIERSESFDYPVKAEIRVPAGTPAAYVAKTSQVTTENELLLAAGTRYRVLSADVIDLGEVDEGEYDERPYTRYVEIVMQVIP